jgi:guanyl-specific ribonuclease Sa
MENKTMIRNMKLRLLLSAVIVAGGFSAVYSAQDAVSKDAGNKPSFEALVQSPGSQTAPDAAVLVPMRAMPEALPADKGNACTPSQALVPGTGFSPAIDDQVRVGAIIDLLDRIANCKPLPYSHDGITNNNSEGGMPQAPAGFYKEYTLIVPGRKTGDGPVPVVIGGKTYMTGAMLSDRGPERIIVGGGKEIYYTMDHYKTFLHLTIVK